VAKMRSPAYREPRVIAVAGRASNSSTGTDGRAGEQRPDGIVIIEARALIRDCLVRAFRVENGIGVYGAPCVEEGLKLANGLASTLFLLSVPTDLEGVDLERDIARLTAHTGSPLAIVADSCNLDLVARVFDLGAVGYISTDLSFEVCVGATRLLLAGGKFVPASALLEARPINAIRTRPLGMYKNVFTGRQVAVLKALTKGKANKAIATELKMQEGTVKVHVRNLMRLLKAHNRTEVALIAVDILRLVDGSELRTDGRRLLQNGNA